MTKLPINLNDLLRQRTVEGDRIEYKAGWNPDPIIRTICAFANDFENLGGGYVVIGQDCDANGQPVFPPMGLADREHFRKTYLAPALEQGVIEMTLPDKPNSRSQRYRLTALGRRWLDEHSSGSTA
jgi:hypothetical protein